MLTLMKVLSQVGVYVGMAITFALGYALFRFFAAVKRPLAEYFKLYCLTLGFVAPIYGVYEFLVRGILGGIGVSSFGGPMTDADWLTPSAIASAALGVSGYSSILSPFTGVSGTCRCGRQRRSISSPLSLPIRSASG